MPNNKRKINPLIQKADAIKVPRYADAEEPHTSNLKESLLEQRRRKALEEKRKFVDDFKNGNDYYYDSLKQEAEKQRKKDEERKKKEELDRIDEEKSTKQKQDKANKKYDTLREQWTNDQLNRGTTASKIAGAMGAGLAATMGVSTGPQPGAFNNKNAESITRSIMDTLFDIKNMLGSGAESMDEGDLQATLGDISKTLVNIGAADAHKRVLELEKQRKDLIDEDLRMGITEGVASADQQIQEIDNQLNSLRDLDNLYKKTYVGDNPTGFWNNVKEFFTDDLWEGIQDAMTYDSAKEYTKQRRIEENNLKYANKLKENGVLTGDNRAYNTPLGPVYSDDYTRELKDIDNFKKQQEEVYKDLTNEYSAKLKRYEDTKAKWNVSSGYRDLIEAYQNGDMFDKNYIFAEYAQMFGTSISSRALLAATGARMASMAGAGAAVLTGNAWLAPWLLNSTELGVTGLDYAGAYHENLQERAMKYLDNVEDLIKNPAIGGDAAYDRIMEDLRSQATKAYRSIGLTEELIKDRLSGPDANKHLIADAAAGIISNEDPILKTAELYANRGLQAQQDANNFRTASDLVLQKALVWMPVKAKANIGGKTWAAVDRAANRAISNNAEFAVEETAKKTLRSRITGNTAEEAIENTSGVYKNANLSGAMRKGYERGMEAGAAVGYGIAGQQIAGVTGAALNSAAHLARTLLSPGALQLLSQVERFGARKYQAVYDKLLKDHDFAKLALKYGFKQAKLHTLTGLSEGAEEAALYIHEKNKTFANKYGWDGMSLGDMIADDITVGGEVMNAYLAMLGMGDSPWANDAQYRANIKGGALLGFMNQSAMLNMAVSGQDVIKQYRVDKVLDDASIVNRELDDRDRAAYSDVVRNVMGKNTQYVLNYLDRMEKEESRRENRVTTPEEIADTRRAVNRISQLVNDRDLKKKLKDSGIEYGTEEYVTAIADQYALENQLRNIIELRNNGTGELSQVYNSREFNDEIDDQVKIVSSQHMAYKADKESAKTQAGDLAVEKAKLARLKEQQFLNGLLDLELAGLAGVDINTPYAKMSDEEFNKKLGQLRSEAEETVEERSESLMRYQLASRAKAINRLTALLNLKAKFNTINGFFDFIHDNFGLNPMRPDSKTIMANVNSQIEETKKQLKELDQQYEHDADNMSEKELYDYLQNNLVSANAHKDIAVQIEQENAVLNAWSAVVAGHMVQVGTDRYKQRVEAINKAREDNKKLNWMISEIESGDAITRLDEDFAKQDAKTAKSIAKEINEEVTSNAMPDFELRSDGQKSNLKSNKEEFYRRREQAKSKKLERRNKYRKGGRLMSGIPFLNVFLDVANELMYAAEVGVYKFQEFVSDLADYAQNNGIDINEYKNDIKQFYIRFRAKAPKEIKDNLDSAKDVISFTSSTNPQPDPVFSPKELTLLEKIDKQNKSIIHSISTHFDIIAEDEDGVHIYTNKEAIKYAKYNENVYIPITVERLKAANTSDDSFREELLKMTSAFLDFPIEDYVHYRNVDGIESAIARRIQTNQNIHVLVGIAVRSAVLAIMSGNDEDVDKSYFGNKYDEFKLQILNIKNELEGSLTLISTPDYLLYTNNGDRNTALADIVFTDNDGNLYIIDVRSTIYPSIRSHYTYISKKGFTIEDLVKDTLKEAELALQLISGKSAKGLYMLPVVVDLKNNTAIVEYDEDGKGLLQVKDRSNPDLSSDTKQLEKSAIDIVNQINDRISQYNDAIDEAGALNTKYDKMEDEVFTPQESVSLYHTYIRNLQTKLDNINDAIKQLDDHIVTNTSTMEDAIEQQLFGDISVKFVDAEESLSSLKECARELDATFDEIKNSGLLITKASTYDERALMDKFVEAVINAQTALDIVLTKEELQDLDVTQEIKLIQAALQEISKHRENFGKAGVFVLNWWINNFAFGILNNTTRNIASVGDQEVAYIKAIKSWIDSIMSYDESKDRWIFNQDLVNVLDDPKNTQLRRLWTSMMHNGFGRLVDNFKEATKNNPNYDGQSDKRIAFAEWVINQFDLMWGTEEDINVSNNPADRLERIKNLSIKWRDLYSENDKHSPAYQSPTNDGRSMASSQLYYLLSTTPGFLLNCTFNFYIKNGELGIDIVGPTRNGQRKHVWLPFLSRPYEGITPADYRRMLIVNRGNLKFIDKVMDLMEFARQNPEYEVRFDVSTDKGSIKYDNPTSFHKVTDWLLAGKNLYTIRLSKNDNIGILKTVITELNGKFYYVFGGDNLKEAVGSFDDEFRKQSISTNSGALIYFKDSGNGLKIGVAIEPAKIGTSMATIIADLISKQAQGITKQDGFDIDSLLRLVLYMKDPQGRISSYNNINSLVLIDGANVKIGTNQPINVFSEKGALINAIAKLNIATDSEVLNSQFLTSLMQCMLTVKQHIAHGEKQVVLPLGITITEDDVIHQNEYGANGSTWLGYMLRNGLLQTRAIGEDYKLLNISNVRLENKNNPSENKPLKDEKPKVSLVETIDLDDLLAKVNMIVQEDELVRRTSIEEENSFTKNVEDYFIRVFGEDKKGLWQVLSQGVIKELPTGYAVGECTSNLMKLSMYAPESAAWHEAFHRVTELLLNSKERSNLYNMYSEAYGATNDRDIAEGLADLFVDYVTKVGLPNGKFFNRVKRFFKSIIPWIIIGKKLGYKNTIRLFSYFNDINNGKFRTATASEEAKARFKDVFGDSLFYTVKNAQTGQTAELEHVADSGQLNQLVNSIGYYIVKALGYDTITPNLDLKVKIDESIIDKIDKDTLDILCGNNVPEDQLTSSQRTFKEILDKKNFGAISNMVSGYIESILNVLAKGRIEKAPDEPNDKDDFGENIDPQNLNIDRYDKASYEFSKLASLSNRVKLFFATIPYYKFNNEGKLETDLTRNVFCTPTFMPIEEVYSVLENDLSDVKSIDELYNKLRKLAKVSEMHAAVFIKFHLLIYGTEKDNGIYGADEFGNMVCRDYDREQLAIQIVSALSSQKLDFIVALSENLGEDKGKDIRISSSSLERDSRSLPMQWGRIFMSGQSQIFATSRNKDGNLLFKDRKIHRRGENEISDVINFIQKVREALTLNNGIVTIDGNNYNKDSIDGITAIKKEFVRNLHRVGVMISDKAFDYMLLNGFGDSGAVGLADCLNGVGGTPEMRPQSIESFVSLLNNIVDGSGNINESMIQKGYPDNGFVKQLAKWQGIYNRVTVQNMALGLNGKLLFSISLNSAISHIILAINSGDINNDVVKTLMLFNYNIDGDKIPIGSILLKALRHGTKQNITAHTYIGLKTDNFGDNGSEYTDAAEVDDYIAKLTMLLEGYMLFPTLADKGTWLVLKGLVIPGMRLLTTRRNKQVSVRCENPVQVTFVGGKPYIMPSDDVIDQMLEYAYTERAAIAQCIEDLKTMPDSAKVKNYHTNNKNTPRDKNGKPKFVVEPNGTRFLLLSKVYVQENGKLVGKNFNDPLKSSKDMLAFADETFFNLPIDKQRRIMGLTLAVQAENEVQKALDLGIIERSTLDKKWLTSTGQEVSVKFDSTEKTLWNLTSKHLNSELIYAIANELMKQIPNKDGGTWATINKDLRRDELLAKMDMAKGLAVAAILADATFRHIISSLEVLRCFAGHPGMFKVEYTETGIKNSTADIQKRLGGLVSTGEDNIQNIPGIPSTYTCAELNDYEVASKSRVASDLKDMFVTAQVRNVYGILTGRWDDVYGMSTEEIINESKNTEYEPKIQKAINDGEDFASMFDGGINVADGAAYITDTMCENLLRMRGAYNNKVKAAFDILRSDKAISWKKSKEAYKTVYDAVNLVTTKYTAYGFRNHVVGEEKWSNISVPYYNKYALFPLFKCIASGKMGSIYQKMLNEDVDMLMMTSAVKVGSCGAVSFNGNEIEQPFNKYEQDFGYLRRQLNTDPEEGDEITMGTLMIKIVLQNLVGERTYIDSRTGREISGEEILDDMMGAINNLSLIGTQEIIDMFSNDGLTIDPTKLANYLQQQLTSRNANKVLLDIIRPYTDPETKLVNIHALSATADASWIESIVISTVNKHVIDITTPGSSYVQRSTFAMEAKDGEGSIQGDENLSSDINGGNRLEMFNEDGSMDCVISIGFFDDIFKGRDMSFEEKREFLIKNGIIGGKASIVAYRIPTQAQSSIHALRVADVIPAVKDTIILPEEFTRITGSDFDIDHLYLARYNYRYDKQQGKLTSWMKKGSKKYYQNKLLGNILTLLTDKNSINTTYKSIDSDVQLPKGCSELIHTNESLESEPYNFGTLRAQVSVKNDFISGKVSIGPFALNSTNHMLTSHYNVKFRNTIVTENTRIKGFTGQLDDDGNFISAWLSGYISGAVDNAKDPFLAKLNTNQFTYNMLNLLLRNGFGETAVWFCAQPIIRDMSAANERSKSLYAKDQSYKNSGYSRKDYAIMQAVKQYVPEHALTAEALKKWTTSTLKADMWSRVEVINWMDKNRELLKEFATNPSLQRITINGVDYNRDYVQLKVFFAWKSLEKYATALGGLVQHTKIDTRKHGKSIIEINRYLDEYLKIFEPDDGSKSIWDMDGLKDFARRTWIELKTKAAIAMPSFILGRYMFSANQQFIQAVLDFGHQITEPGEQLSSDVANKISRHLLTAVKSKYFVNYVADNLVIRDKEGNPTETASEHIRKLFIGPRSMAKRLTGLKLAIELNPMYKRLETNGLIRQLFSATEDPSTVLHGELTEMPGFINVLDSVDSSKINSDLLTDGWEDLLKDQDQYVRAFAQDLIIYAFMTSGEFKGWTKLFKYVPASFITGEINPEYESYASYIENILSNGYDYRQHFDEIAANCFGDRSIVEMVPMNNHDGTANFVDLNTICKIGKAIDVAEIDAVKPYILVKQDLNGRNTDAYNLYKLIGFKRHGEDILNPIYIRIKKQGYLKGLNNIYEYGWDFLFRGNENRVMNENYDISAAIEGLLNYNWDYDSQSAKEIQSRYLELAKPHEELADYPDYKFIEYSDYTEGFDINPEELNEEEIFYTKENAQEYLLDLAIDGKNPSDYEIVHVPETETEDDYYVVRKKDNNPALNEASNSSEHKQC